MGYVIDLSPDLWPDKKGVLLLFVTIVKRTLNTEIYYT